MDSLPVLSEDLLKELAQLYPPITHSTIMKTSKKQLAYTAGQRSVVEHLLMVRDRTDEEDLLG